MSRFEDALLAFKQASEAERNWTSSDGPFAPVMARRDAALRELHEAEDPWQPCKCQVCAGRD